VTQWNKEIENTQLKSGISCADICSNTLETGLIYYYHQGLAQDLFVRDCDDSNQLIGHPCHTPIRFCKNQKKATRPFISRFMETLAFQRKPRRLSK